MEIGSWASWAQAAIAVCGLLVAWVQWQKHKKIISAKHLSDVLKDFCNEKVRATFSKYVDRSSTGKRYYTGVDNEGEPTFANDMCEIEIDDMLLLFENICYQVHNGIIQDNAYRCFEYQIRTTLDEKQIQDYLADLARYCSKKGGGFPFVELLRHGVRIESVSSFYSDVLRMLFKA